MPTGLIDLRSRSRESVVLLAIGSVLTVLFVLGLLATLVAGPEPLPLRLAAGGVGVAIVVLALVAWWTRN
ncbi:MAG: hypothetical protein H7Y15_03700, partial [Pseudonocardia sp.]|nr:hypothetical protein [Pseudonocardia sp.]